MLSRRSAASVAEAYESMADTSRGSSIPPTPARSMARRSRSGPLGSGGRAQVKVEREVELVGRVLVLGQPEDGVLEGEQGPRVDLEREVQVERAAAARPRGGARPPRPGGASRSRRNGARRGRGSRGRRSDP